MPCLFEEHTQLGALMNRHDWSRTPLGPPDTWPLSLRTIVSTVLGSRYPFWIGWGPELLLLYNDPYAQILGTKHPAALGRPASEVWHEIWHVVGPRIDRVMSTGRATFDEALLLVMERHGYAEETYFTFSYSPLFDDDGAIAGNFCVVVEDTERVIGARRLALLRDLATSLASATSERDVFAAVELSLAGEPRDIPFSLFYTFDPAASQARLKAWTGFEDETGVEDLIDLSNPSAPWLLNEVAAGRIVSPMAYAPGDRTLPHGAWDTTPRQVLVLPLAQQGQAAPAGALIAGLNPCRPFDEGYQSFLSLVAGQVASGLANARAHEEDRRRAESLAALDRAKTAFFSNVSHEFRTPLTLMLGPTEDALAGTGAMNRDQLETVYRNQLRLLKLVNSLLDFSRIEAGRARATYEPTDLAALTADLASTFRSAFERAGLGYDVDCAPLKQPVYVDPQMWEKIVLNLLSNAFKFTLDGRVRVTLTAERGDAVLRVEDTGVGIAPSDLPHVFDRFHRVEGTRARTHEGSGIGLALVHDLVKLHAGAISVTSEPGRGTAFQVRIPFGTAHLPQDQVGVSRTHPDTAASSRAFVLEAERWLDAPPVSEPAAHAQDVAALMGTERVRIVVADDNADMRDYLTRLLGTRWAVEAAANGRQALDAVRRQLPAMVITDVMMPELDGVELVRALRGSEATREVPVLMLSARAGEEARLEGVHAGADDYLVKPFSARELIARVETQLLRASMRAVENQQRRHLTEIFRRAPAAIALLRGPNHVYEHANPAYLSLVGGRRIVGLPIREALPEFGSQGIFGRLDHVYATGEPYVGKAFRLTIVPSPGAPAEEHFFDFVYEPMRDGTGAVDGIAVVAFDVTDLVRARREAELANRAKDEFLAMLGHELRNPLAPMRTALQLMRLRGGDAMKRERTVIERQTQHLVRLVDDLLDVSRIARGKIELRRERLEVADAVAKAIEMASPLLEERQHDLIVDVTRGLDVEADPARLSQIIANLLNNAAKYTETGGKVRIGAEQQDGWILIRVKDSGIGISPEMLPRVFDMFAQERQALDRTQGGLGLGLTIVRNLVALHGGTVEARSEGRGRGSEFVVRLPAPKAVGPRPSTGEAADVLPEGPAGATRVLIVDDNVDAAEMFAAYLSSLGYEVRAVHDGPAALRVSQAFTPSVALLDIGLPVMDGYELAGRLREAMSGHAVKLIAVTGYGQETDRARSQHAGFDAHLVKPVDLNALARLLADLSAT